MLLELAQHWLNSAGLQAGLPLEVVKALQACSEIAAKMNRAMGGG